MKKKKKVSPFRSPVILKLKAYKRIVGYAHRYANNSLSSDKWREVYGILIGSIENDKDVIVKDAIPMVVGDRAGVKYENKQYVDMAQIDATVFERSIQDERNDFIIGWFHTHPGFGFFFSPIDQLTHLGYQLPNPYAVALIFDHTERGSDAHYLGIAGLRVKDPGLGISSTYDLIELSYEDDKEVMFQKADKTIKTINKNMSAVLKEIDYVEGILRKKALAQLQRNYGLILVPKEDIKVTDVEEEADEDEGYLYTFDPEFFKKSYRIPKFREKVEKFISEAYDDLDEMTKEKDTERYDAKKKKLVKKAQNILDKPNEWYDKLMNDFSKKIEKISPYYDYLDTNERKIIEH
ncbi:MAG: Mov34/MPN/PAD-1 family protein [Promethearchaeota archaeon]|jgi:proteasome lid subunit RPN8/RPN11